MTLTRTPYWLTRSEMVQSMANRIMYSRFYIGLYIGLAALSVLSIVMVKSDPIPTTPWYTNLCFLYPLYTILHGSRYARLGM